MKYFFFLFWAWEWLHEPRWWIRPQPWDLDRHDITEF